MWMQILQIFCPVINTWLSYKSNLRWTGAENLCSWKGLKNCKIQSWTSCPNSAVCIFPTRNLKQEPAVNLWHRDRCTGSGPGVSDAHCACWLRTRGGAARPGAAAAGAARHTRGCKAGGGRSPGILALPCSVQAKSSHLTFLPASLLLSVSEHGQSKKTEKKYFRLVNNPSLN